MRLVQRQPRIPNLQGINKPLSILGMTLLLLGYWYLALRLEQINYSVSPPIWVQTIQTILTILSFSEVFIFLFTSVAEFFSWSVLIYLIPLLMGWWLGRQAILGMLQSFYDLPDSSAAASLLNRLSATRLGFIKPTLISLENFEEAKKKDPLLKVGGPGRILIIEGIALVTELQGRFYRVLGPGKHNLDRFEFPRTIVDLRPQNRELDNVRMMTSDGIELTTNLTVTFQIDQGEAKPTPQKPFPYNEDAVRIAAYTETNLPDNKLGLWDSLPMLLTVGQLRAIVAEDRLDELILSDPNGIDVHRRLQMEMERRAKAALRNFGITVRGTRLGAFELPEEVEEQRIKYWQVFWDTQRTLQMADGEAAVLESEEFARAEAGSVILRAIAEGLQHAERSGRSISTRAVVAQQLTESIETMVEESRQVLPLPARLIPQVAIILQQLTPLAKLSEAATEMTVVVLELPYDLKDFTLEKQEQFVHFIARIAEIDPEQIKILDVIAGSTLFKLEIPDKNVKSLTEVNVKIGPLILNFNIIHFEKSHQSPLPDCKPMEGISLVLLENISRPSMFDFIKLHFDDRELRHLCFCLDVDYDGLEGQGKWDKARELVEYCKRYGKFDQLIGLCQSQRTELFEKAFADSH